MAKNLYSRRGFIPRSIRGFTSNPTPGWGLLNIQKGFTLPLLLPGYDSYCTSLLIQSLQILVIPLYLCPIQIKGTYSLVGVAYNVIHVPPGKSFIFSSKQISGDLEWPVLIIIHTWWPACATAATAFTLPNKQSPKYNLVVTYFYSGHTHSVSLISSQIIRLTLSHKL